MQATVMSVISLNVCNVPFDIVCLYRTMLLNRMISFRSDMSGSSLTQSEPLQVVALCKNHEIVSVTKQRDVSFTLCLHKHKLNFFDLLYILNFLFFRHHSGHQHRHLFERGGCTEHVVKKYSCFKLKNRELRLHPSQRDLTLASVALVDVTNFVPVGIACVSCKHCLTRIWFLTCSLYLNWRKLLVCDVVGGVVIISTRSAPPRWRLHCRRVQPANLQLTSQARQDHNHGFFCGGRVVLYILQFTSSARD